MKEPTPEVTRARARHMQAKTDVEAARIAMRKARNTIEREHRRLDEADAQLKAARKEELRAERAVAAMTWNQGGTGPMAPQLPPVHGEEPE